MSSDTPLLLGVAAVLWKDGRMLMGERLGAHGANTWSFPGGHIEEGENPRQAAAREVQEETGIKLSPAAFGALTFSHDVFAHEGRRYITLYLGARHVQGEPRVMEPSKCGGWRWVKPSQLPHPLFLPVQNVLRQGYVFTPW